MLIINPRTMIFSKIIFLGVLTVVSAQVPIPKKKVGFVYNPKSQNAPVHLDIYIDQICPDSKRAWPTMLQLADHYGPDKLRLTTHEFPLPYHRNGFFASKGAFIVQSTDPEMPYSWIQKVFDNYDSLINSANKQKSDYEMISKLAEIAGEIGVENSTFWSKFQNDSMELKTRVEWKYGCSRGVAETPTFMVNDVVVGYTEESYWNVEDWKRIIDPLFGITPPSTSSTPPSTEATTAAEGSSASTVLPGAWSVVFGINALILQRLT